MFNILANVQSFQKYCNTDYISNWKLKGLSDEIIKPPTTSDNSLSFLLSFTDDKTREKFDGGCLKQDKITFTHGKTVNIYIVYEINLSNYLHSNDPTLGNYLLGAVKLVKDADKYSGSGIGFDMKGTFSFPTGRFGRNWIIFEADMNSSPHVDNKKKYILILVGGSTKGLDDTTLIAEINIQSILLSILKSFL